MNLAVSLLVLVILVLLNSPVLDSMRSVNSHMARYPERQNTPDRVTITCSNRAVAMDDAARVAEKCRVYERPETRAGSADGVRWRATSSEGGVGKIISRKCVNCTGSGKPDAAFWSALIKERYNVMTCIEKDACVLVEQDLNSDGRAERILFAFDDENIVYGFDPDKKE